MGQFFESIERELEIYVRHMAWLNSTPDGAELSRAEIFEQKNFDVLMPDCSAPYLIEYLLELGVSMGEHSLTHGELESWMNNTGIRLSAFEVRALKRLSQAYLSTGHAATKEDYPTPWDEAPYYMSKKYRKEQKLKASFKKAMEI